MSGDIEQPVLLYAHPSMEHLAEQVVSRCSQAWLLQLDLNDKEVPRSSTAVSQKRRLSETQCDHEEFTTGTPLPTIKGKFMSTDQILQAVGSESNVLDSVPVGKKDNVYFIVDDSSNFEKRRNNQRSDFPDDCGGWDREKSHSVNSYIILDENRKAKTVYWKENLYCSEIRIKGKSTYVPLVPQPDDDSVLKLHRYYATLKAEKNYKKRVTCIDGAGFTDVAVIEYSGERLNPRPAHGNAKRQKKEYVRKAPKVMTKISKAVKLKPQRKVIQELLEKSSESPGIFKQGDSARRGSMTSQRPVQFQKTIDWGKFPDGFPNLFINDVRSMAGKDVIFLSSFHSPEVIFEQLSVLYMFPRYLARSFHILLPYFPTGTMERVEMEGQVATAKTLATLLSAIPLTARGPAQITIFDIHALQERFYFSDSIIPRLESAVPLLLRQLQSHPDRGNMVFAFPDDGAQKRFKNFFSGDQTIVCTKIREGNKRIVKVKDGDPTGKHVVVVDDLVMTGGTLIECVKALREKGANLVSCYVTHGVFPNKSWQKFTDSAVPVETFWITDSLPHATEICQHKPFQLISLCEAIAEELIGYDLLNQ